MTDRPPIEIKPIIPTELTQVQADQQKATTLNREGTFVTPGKAGAREALLRIAEHLAADIKKDEEPQKESHS